MIVHQLLMGQDIAKDGKSTMHMMAAQMANFCYVIEDSKTSQAILVDAAWDVDGVLRYCSSHQLKVHSAVFTHRHLDHTGGRVPLRGLVNM